MFEVFGRTGPPILGGRHFGVWTLTREPEMLQPDAFWEYTMQQNSTAAVAPSRTPRIAYTAPPDNLVGFKGLLCGREEEEKKGNRRAEREGKRREGEGRFTLMQWRIQRGPKGHAPQTHDRVKKSCDRLIVAVIVTQCFDVGND